MNLWLVLGFIVLIALFIISYRLWNIVEETRKITERLDKIVERLDFISDSMPDEFRDRHANERVNEKVKYYRDLADIPQKTK